MIEEKKVVKQKIQNIIIENREKISVSGIIDVESFNDECVIVDTELGVLVIRGEDLHISKLSIDNSELNIEGEIVSCEYNEKENTKSRGGSFLSRMFK